MRYQNDQGIKKFGDWVIDNTQMWALTEFDCHILDNPFGLFESIIIRSIEVQHQK